jgi:hypothetical protein
MAYFELNPNAVKRQDVLALKAHLLAAKNSVEQLKREKDTMTEEQIQALFGFGGTEAQFDATIDGVWTALSDAAVLNMISNVGPGDGREIV